MAAESMNAPRMKNTTFDPKKAYVSPALITPNIGMSAMARRLVIAGGSAPVAQSAPHKEKMDRALQAV